ncbi:hypothetical protein LTR50_006154 [Elasticomyces elasticus]|nr:hypothetical protein LTR50_006154 [Elasticomyces elasticus]
MSGDPSEKFFMEDWDFDSNILDTTVSHNPFAPVQANAVSPISGHELYRSRQAYAQNQSYTSDMPALELSPPFLVHVDKELASYLRFLPRSVFGRAFQCPAGTTNCASIGQTNSCCQNGETCITTTDTGLGTVGCCPAGEICGGSVSTCDTASGYKSCPNSPNGGCCIPGYACQDVGCVLINTVTRTTTIPVATVTSGAVYTTASYASSTVTFVFVSSSPTASPSVVSSSSPAAAVPPIQTSTTTVSVAPSTSAISTTTQVFQGPLTCSAGYQSCPASLGGGCCPTDRACGAVSCPALSISTTTATAVAPVRPTSNSEITTITQVTSTAAVSSATTAAVSACPTGFYMCSAYYLGGCCRVGRNCDTTSCPASASTNIVVQSGVTIVAASGATGVITVTSTSVSTALSGSTTAAVVGSQGSCANSWYSCPASVGGGCCPSGYVCGASCTATISGVSNVGKAAPSGANAVMFLAWSFLVGGLAVGVGMVLL